MNNATIKDVARIAGVGLGTVSRVINNHPGVHPKTRERVLAVIRETGYVPNNSARNLKRTQSDTIGVLMCGMGSLFFQSALSAIESCFRGTCFSVASRQIRGVQPELDSAISFIKEKRLCGLVILGGRGGQPESRAQALQDTGVPCVFVSVSADACPALEKRFSCLTIDDVRSAYRAVDFLCSLSHKRILLMTAECTPHSVSDLRRQGYQQALRANGIPFDSGLLADCPGYSMREGYAAMKRTLEQRVDYTAVFAVSDVLAVGASKAILERGLRIPEDISVMGFDGIELTRYYHPSLTTIQQPIVQMAADGAALLKQAMHAPVENLHKIYETTLIPGGSTAVCAG